MIKTLSPKKIAAIVVGAVIAVAIVAGVVHFSHPSEERKAEVTQGLAEINKSLPKMIDSLTRLDNVSTSDGSDVIYHYTIVGASVQKVQDADLKPMQAQVVKAYCTNPQLTMFRQNDMTLKYMYYREDASFVGELDAKAKDCPQPAAQ